MASIDSSSSATSTTTPFVIRLHDPKGEITNLILASRQEQCEQRIISAATDVLDRSSGFTLNRALERCKKVKLKEKASLLAWAKSGGQQQLPKELPLAVIGDKVSNFSFQDRAQFLYAFHINTLLVGEDYLNKAQHNKTYGRLLLHLKQQNSPLYWHLRSLAVWEMEYALAISKKNKSHLEYLKTKVEDSANSSKETLFPEKTVLAFLEGLFVFDHLTRDESEAFIREIEGIDTTRFFECIDILNETLC